MSRFSEYPQSITESIQSVKDDYSQYITKPPDRNITHGRTSKYFVIDSRDRDKNKYPEANRYRLDVPQEWRDIISAELIYGSIPNTYYNVTDFNNTFYITEDSIHLTSIKLPVGQYDNQKLLDTFNGVYGNLFSGLTNQYYFTKNVINNTLRIQSNRKSGTDFEYNINYLITDSCSPCPYRSIDEVIGFKNNLYRSTEIDLSAINTSSITNLSTESVNGYPLLKLVATNASGDFKSLFQSGDSLILNGAEIRIYEIKNASTFTFEITDGTPIVNLTVLSGVGLIQNMSVLISPNIFHIECNPYVVLKIRDFQNYNSNNASENSYTIIQLNNNPCTIINQATIPVDGVTKNFNPPLPRLPYIDLEFCNPDGTPFEFRGEDHMLVLRLNMLNQPAKYNNYISVDAGSVK
jgi:hypothetical protein